MAAGRRIAVVGAGIIGASTATWLRDRLPPGDEVVVFGKELSPHTTGESSAGIFIPYCLEGTPEDRLLSWFKRTWDFLTSLLRDPDHQSKGVYFQPAFLLDEKPMMPRPIWADIVATFSPLERPQCVFPSAQSGFSFTTVGAEGRKILKDFYTRLQTQGVRIIKRKISSLEALVDEGFDLIINCSGVGAKELVQDEAVFPIRGQIHLVRAPWIRFAIQMGSTYIIPNMDRVVLGGTAQVGDWSEEVREEDRKAIYEGCCKLVPSCSKAEEISAWVGLRPGRRGVRVEHEARVTADGARYDVVHNYGHGGSGFSLFWGCAEDAGKLALQLLGKSKL